MVANMQLSPSDAAPGIEGRTMPPLGRGRQSSGTPQTANHRNSQPGYISPQEAHGLQKQGWPCSSFGVSFIMATKQPTYSTCAPYNAQSRSRRRQMNRNERATNSA